MYLMGGKGVGGLTQFFFLLKKTGLSRGNKGRQRNEYVVSCSPAHVGEIFKGDARRYCQGHRKVSTSFKARGMVKERSVKIKGAKRGKGEKAEKDGGKMEAVCKVVPV